MTLETLALAYSPLELGSLLQCPAIRSNAGMANRRGGRRLALCASLCTPVSTLAWLGMCVGHGYLLHTVWYRIRCQWFLLEEGIVGFCELKMFKLGSSCIYKRNNGLGVIRTSYFACKSEALLITVMSRNAELYKIAHYVCCIQPVQANGTNPNISRKRTLLVKYSIGCKSSYDDSFGKA